MPVQENCKAGSGNSALLHFLKSLCSCIISCCDQRPRKRWSKGGRVHSGSWLEASTCWVREDLMAGTVWDSDVGCEGAHTQYGRSGSKGKGIVGTPLTITFSYDDILGWSPSRLASPAQSAGLKRPHRHAQMWSKSKEADPDWEARQLVSHRPFVHSKSLLCVSCWILNSRPI